jgi:hypothetical protein
MSCEEQENRKTEKARKKILELLELTTSGPEEQKKVETKGPKTQQQIDT